MTIEGGWGWAISAPTARVCEIDPNTVLQWLVEAAEPLQAFSASCLCDVHVRQRQLDALYAVLRSVKDGESSADNAIKCLERSRHWVWTVRDPESQRLLAIASGPRLLARAQHVGHQGVGGLAPGCAPAWLRDGFKGYLPAMVGHFGLWVHPGRSPDNGPWPQPRWMPLPGLLEAQVVQSSRRQRLVAVTPGVGCGTLAAVEQG